MSERTLGHYPYTGLKTPNRRLLLESERELKEMESWYKWYFGQARFIVH